MARKIEGLVRELSSNHDMAEAVSCLRQEVPVMALPFPQCRPHQSKLVAQVVTASFEGNDHLRTVSAAWLLALAADGLLHRGSVIEAFVVELFPTFDDLSCDVPKLPQYTSEFLGPLLRAGLLSIEFLAHTLPSGIDNRAMAASLIAATLGWLVKDQGEEKTQALLATAAERPFGPLVNDTLRERFGLTGLQL